VIGSVSATRQAAATALVVAIAASVLLILVPRFFPSLYWIGWPFQWLFTLCHEMGHGIAALVSGGGFERLVVFADGSGVATTSRDPGSRLQAAFIAAGGLIGPPVVAAVLFGLARKPGSSKSALWGLAIFLAVALLLWVRNPFGIVLVAAFAALLALAARVATANTAQALLCFLAVQLCLSTLMRADYLFTTTARTGAGEMASDTAQIANALFLPAFVWGVGIALLSGLILVLGVLLFLGALRR